MEALPVLAIVAAAFLHAIWNFILKDSQDKAVCILIIYFTSLPFAIIAMFLSGLPDVNTLPIILLSAVFQTGYSIVLFKGYEAGSLTSVYPIARGSAPVFIFFYSLIFFDIQYSPQVILGASIICIGLLVYSGFALRRSRSPFNEIPLALCIGMFIAAYSITDAVATRLIGNAFSFFGAMAIFNRLFLTGYLYFFEENIITRIHKEFNYQFLFAGSFAFICYVVVLWAYTVIPVPIVSALRETSIVFAVLIGVFVLQERIDVGKALLVTSVSIGLFLLLMP